VPANAPVPFDHNVVHFPWPLGRFPAWILAVETPRLKAEEFANPVHDQVNLPPPSFAQCPQVPGPFPSAVAFFPYIAPSRFTAVFKFSFPRIVGPRSRTPSSFFLLFISTPFYFPSPLTPPLPPPPVPVQPNGLNPLFLGLPFEFSPHDRLQQSCPNSFLTAFFQFLLSLSSTIGPSAFTSSSPDPDARHNPFPPLIGAKHTSAQRVGFFAFFPGDPLTFRSDQ